MPKTFESVDDATEFLYNVIFTEGDGLHTEFHRVIESLMGRDLNAREQEQARESWLSLFD